MSYWHDSCKKKEIGYIGTYIAYKINLVYQGNLFNSYIKGRRLQKAAILYRSRISREGLTGRIDGKEYPTRMPLIPTPIFEIPVKRYNQSHKSHNSTRHALTIKFTYNNTYNPNSQPHNSPKTLQFRQFTLPHPKTKIQDKNPKKISGKKSGKKGLLGAKRDNQV